MLTAAPISRPGAARLLATCAALALAGALPAACADAPTAASAAAAREPAALAFSASVAAAPEVATMVLSVSAADIATPVVANLAIVGGVASGTLRVTAGAARTVTAQAFDRTGALAYEGSTVVEVRAGQNPPVAVTLVGASGRLPITATIGSVTLAVTKAGGDTLFLGDRRQFTAALKDAAGQPVTGTVTWASSNPALASVDSAGRVTALAAGPVDIVATYAGVAARASVVVDARASTDFLVLEVQEVISLPQYVARIASDGAHFQRLTPPQTTGIEVGGRYPAWSPDRSRIAFSRYSSSTGTHDLYVMNADGSDMRRVLDRDTEDLRPRWSPDGTRLVFESVVRSSGSVDPQDLYVVNLDGTGLRRLTSGAEIEDQASWSPDGTRILFRTHRNGVWSLYTIRPDGTDERPVRADAMPAADPAWSPDGRRIVFRGFPNAAGDGLYVMNADGTNTVRLTAPNGVADAEPAWSPDGQQIAFTTTREDAGAQVYRMRADGTGITRVRIPATHIYAGRPAWR